MKNGLRIASDLVLPLETITQTLAILAIKGAGKTNTATVLAEEFLKKGLQTVIADPVGVLWGLRSSANGKDAGLHIVIFGGEKGDVPLEATGGALVADLVVDEHISAVLDLSLLRKGEQTRFMTDFAERLYHRKGKLTKRSPLHLILDEADAFAPQRPMHGQVELAPIDLQKLENAMQETIEKAKADDPKALRGRITELEAALKKAQAVKPEIEVKEVPVFTDADRDTLGVLADSIDNKVFHSIKQLTDKLEELWGFLVPVLSKAQAVQFAPKGFRVLPSTPTRQSHPTARPSLVGGAAKLPTGERKILTVLAQYPQGRTKVQIAVLTGYAHSGGSFNNYLSALRSKGCIEGTGEGLTITSTGLEVLGPYELLPTGQALLEYWYGQLGKAEKSILQALANEYPHSMAKEDLAARTCYEASGGGFNNALSRLRTLELISGKHELKASEALFG